MKLLLDANLSWRLIKLLNPDFTDVHHVDSIGLNPPASDVDIWDWAKQNQAIIVTNDEDFENLLLQKGFPPKIVLLRTGNQATKTVAALLVKYKKDIKLLHLSTSYGLLEIF